MNSKVFLAALRRKKKSITLPAKRNLKKKNRTEVSRAEHWFSACTQWRRCYLLCSPLMHINLQLSLKYSKSPEDPNLTGDDWLVHLHVAPPSPFLSFRLSVSLDACTSRELPLPPTTEKNPAAFENQAPGVRRDGDWTLATLQTLKPSEGSMLINAHRLRDITSLLPDQNGTICKQIVFSVPTIWNQTYN